MKRTFDIVDTTFAHDVGTTAGRTPRYWRWNRTGVCPFASGAPTFYGNDSVLRAPIGADNCCALLIESKAIMGKVYQAFPSLIDRFQRVFTHDQSLLDANPDKCHFIPGGGVWIGGDYGLGEIGIPEKSGLVSLVSSTKNLCPLHEFRFQLARSLSGDPRVDVFIGGGGKGTPGWVPIAETLNRYRYSIVIENTIDDGYFTEKILNCFATGVVPIYHGARRIGDWFDAGGILPFTTRAELLEILERLSPEDYHARQASIAENLARCRQYECVEDYLATRYHTLLGGDWREAPEAPPPPTPLRERPWTARGRCRIHELGLRLGSHIDRLRRVWRR
ncbi:MAG: glycosyltransferase family 10 domain-containing protein [Alphaproteobacteria bacterium]